MLTERGRPLWLGRHGVFAAAHLPSLPVRTGVVLAPPFGWEEMASYPVRREWASSLAERGWPVLRLDWPSTGDSPGLPGDLDRLDAWCEALEDAVEWLRAETGVVRVATIGLSLGGLVAVEAIRRGVRCEDLVLWPVHRDGRAFLRAERALSSLQSARSPADHEALPPGWLESSGYVLAESTISTLQPVQGWIEAPSSLERVLLLDREGTAVDPAVIAGFRAAGTEVQTGRGEGYVAMIYAPHWPKAPFGVINQVAQWLVSAPPGHAAETRVVASSHELRLTDAREYALEFPCERGAAFAIVTEPDRRDPTLPTLVLLPAWAERRSGPNRMWTEAARRAAARGGAAVRLDLPGVGDSVGDREWLANTLNVVDPVIVTEIRQILDQLDEAGLGTEFVLVGLSVGAYWAFRTVAADTRVLGALAINPGVEALSPEQQASEVMRKIYFVLRPSWWRRIIRREVRLSSLVHLARTTLRVRLASLRQSAIAKDTRSPLEKTLSEIGERGAFLTLAAVGEERLDGVLTAEGLRERLLEWPRIQLVDLDSLDHNVRPIRAQRQVHTLIEELVSFTATAGGEASSTSVEDLTEHFVAD